MPAIVENVVYQHAENVCSLWLQRQNAVDEPHYSFSELVHLDNRVEANLDGLRVAGVHGLPFIEEMIQAEDGGAHFAKALLALEREDSETFSSLVEHAEGNSPILAEIESALAWVDPKHLKTLVKTLLTSDKNAAIILGLKTCASHNRDPGKYLEEHFRNIDPKVRSVTLRVGADLGNRSFAKMILANEETETNEEAYERGRSLAFLGEPRAARQVLKPLALNDSTYNAQAVNLLVQMGDAKEAKGLLKSLDSVKGRERDVVRGFGLLGDPVAMNWLIEKTEIRKLSRLSGESITMITGIDLAEQDLVLPETPAGLEDGGISDDPEDENVDVDEDEDLPWPDPNLIKLYWENSIKLPVGSLFLNGRERNQSELQQVLVFGLQRQRNAATESLAMLNPESGYLNTRLPTNKQRISINRI